MQFVGIYYLCEIGQGKISLQKEEVSNFEWVGLDNIDTISILEPSKSIIKDYLQRLEVKFA